MPYDVGLVLGLGVTNMFSLTIPHVYMQMSKTLLESPVFVKCSLYM